MTRAQPALAPSNTRTSTAATSVGDRPEVDSAICALAMSPPARRSRGERSQRQTIGAPARDQCTWKSNTAFAVGDGWGRSAK